MAPKIETFDLSHIPDDVVGLILSFAVSSAHRVNQVCREWRRLNTAATEQRLLQYANETVDKCDIKRDFPILPNSICTISKRWGHLVNHSLPKVILERVAREIAKSLVERNFNSSFYLLFSHYDIPHEIKMELVPFYVKSVMSLYPVIRNLADKLEAMKVKEFGTAHYEKRLSLLKAVCDALGVLKDELAAAETSLDWKGFSGTVARIMYPRNN